MHRGTPGFDSNYVFYYFQNFLTYGTNTATYYTLADITQFERVRLLQEQINAIKARTQFLTSSNGEAGMALEELLDKKLIENNLVLGMNSLSINVTGNQKLNKDLTLSSTERINALAESLAQDMSIFMDSLNNMIEEMWSHLTKTTTLDAYREMVIAQYAKTHSVKGDIAQQILRGFLTDGLKELNAPPKSNPEVQLEADIQKCINLAMALPSYKDYVPMNTDTFPVKANTSLAGSFFRVLLRKLAGLKAHAQGKIGEIAAAAGLKTANAYALKQISDATAKAMGIKNGKNSVRIRTSYTGTGTSYKNSWIGVTTEMVKDPELAETSSEKNRRQLYTTNKKDVEVIIEVLDGNGTVVSTANYGANVKYYTIKPGNKFITYTIHDSGSFAAAYDRAFPEDRSHIFINNLASGHTAQRRLGGETAAGLDAQWTQLVRTVAVTNLTTALAGGIKENTLLLVLNKRAFLIADVLEKILSYIKSGESGYKESNSEFGYGYQISGISRRKMQAASKWIISSQNNKNKTGRSTIAGQNMSLAIKRSDAARPQLKQLMDSAKITISLRTLTSVILGS